jgi:hypothetical protein
MFPEEIQVEKEQISLFQRFKQQDDDKLLLSFDNKLTSTKGITVSTKVGTNKLGETNIGKLPPVKPPSASTSNRPPSPPSIKPVTNTTNKPLFTKLATGITTTVKPTQMNSTGITTGTASVNKTISSQGSSSALMQLSSVGLSPFTSQLITLSAGENCEVGLVVSTSGLNNSDELIKITKKMEEGYVVVYLCVCDVLYV